MVIRLLNIINVGTVLAIGGITYNTVIPYYR